MFPSDNTAINSTVGAIFIAAALKVVDRFLTKEKEVKDEGRLIREELRVDLKTLREANESLRKSFEEFKAQTEVRERNTRKIINHYRAHNNMIEFYCMNLTARVQRTERELDDIRSKSGLEPVTHDPIPPFPVLLIEEEEQE